MYIPLIHLFLRLLYLYKTLLFLAVLPVTGKIKKQQQEKRLWYYLK